MSARSINWPVIELVPHSSLRPSTYNPRESDPQRLALVSLSLRKLGWLLPVFADTDGEIYSGHQRHLVAGQVGYSMVPVVRVPQIADLNERKAINLLFNRATNDMAREDTSKGLTDRLSLYASTIQAAEDWPDLDPSSPEAFACARAEMLPIAPFLKSNTGRWNDYLAKNAGALHGSGLFMPVVTGPEHYLVNGVGRLQYAASNGEKQVQAVAIPAERVGLATALLNCLTMDFAVHTRYADLLRHNSFRRAHHVKPNLGLVFLFDAFGMNVSAKDVDLHDSASLRKWKQTYGTSVLDFGAGHLDDTERIRKLGVSCVPFEPYQTTGIEIDKAKSRGDLLKFLQAVKEGVRFDSIFQNSIMNSVPFIQDRQHIVRLIASLCTPRTTVFACAASTNYHAYQNVRGSQGADAGSDSLHFQLDYEEHTIVSELHKQPKIQKYHTPAEWYDLWSIAFERVKAEHAQHKGMVHARCSKPRPISPAELRQAIEFEFNLPYPDGSRMGLVNEAMAAFSARRGIDLSRI